VFKNVTACKRIGHLPQLQHEALELRARHDAQRRREIAVFGIDLLENAGLRSGHGGSQQGLETIRNAGERGMNDHRPQRGGDAGPDHARDVVPIGGGGHAGAPELEHNPGLTIF
jgi:hypothetical protein